jgi:hypothetical protein
MAKFRKKPVVIEAVQLRWENWNDVCELAGRGLEYTGPDSVVMRGVSRADGKIEATISTLEGTMTASENDWIIRGVKGEIYPCKPEIFDATYEPAVG